MGNFTSIEFMIIEMDADDLSSLSILDEIEDLRRKDTDIQVKAASWWLCAEDGGATGPSGEVVFFPELGRAGVNWGGDTEWTDAANELDALQRYFEVAGKFMNN